MARAMGDQVPCARKRTAKASRGVAVVRPIQVNVNRPGRPIDVAEVIRELVRWRRDESHDSRVAGSATRAKKSHPGLSVLGDKLSIIAAKSLTILI